MSCRHPVQFRFGDFDMLGHVNNAEYLSYFEDARLAFFLHVLSGDRAFWKEPRVILASITVDFLRLVEELAAYEIAVSCTHIGHKSFTLNYKLHRQGREQPVFAQGSSVLVCYDYQKKKTVPVFPDG